MHVVICFEFHKIFILYPTISLTLPVYPIHVWRCVCFLIPPWRDCFLKYNQSKKPFPCFRILAPALWHNAYNPSIPCQSTDWSTAAPLPTQLPVSTPGRAGEGGPECWASAVGVPGWNFGLLASTWPVPSYVAIWGMN